MQVMSVCLGGTMYQDASENPGAEEHPTGLAQGFKPVVAAQIADEPLPELLMHELRTSPGSVVAEHLVETTQVNSYHHQHLRDLPDGVVATGVAGDGVIEAIELPAARSFALGVQWELQAGWREDPELFSLYDAFVAAAAARAGRENGGQPVAVAGS
jgi:gamma-glutamyl-gamma-aminobutyrate hydrolase PuuD